ncbi:MAG: hypothetical protein FJ272_05025 [Planctomycetes bacterium]|nr:hypothetical protein [Planctomycetota bacterium]
MGSVKESIHDAIDRMSDEEARRLLEFVKGLRKKTRVSATLRRLAEDPAFSVPPQRNGGFRAVKPVQGKGVPASRLLVEDRR